MNHSRVLLIAAVFMISIGFCSAAAVEEHVSKYTIVDSTVVVQTAITFSEAQTGVIEIPAPSNIEALDVYVDGAKAEASAGGNLIKVNAESAKKISLSYTTEDFIDKTNFLMSFPVNNEIAKLRTALYLPEGAALKYPLNDVAGSVYPKPDKAGTDGRSLVFIWEMENLKPGDELSIFAMYEPKENNAFLIALLVIVALAFAGYVAYNQISKKANKKKPVEIKVVKHAKEHEIIDHLKEEEQQIVRVLKQRDGQCEQGTLRVVTGFSKAHLSRLLSELEARKVVFKEKRGKKNLVFFKD